MILTMSDGEPFSRLPPEGAGYSGQNQSGNIEHKYGQPSDILSEGPSQESAIKPDVDHSPSLVHERQAHSKDVKPVTSDGPQLEKETQIGTQSGGSSSSPSCKSSKGKGFDIP